ncbi:hypothetical protein [Alistipes sp. UBA1686]|uniref:hypothetical protein n=1 Tax=Alistipes sp. UBA1686 TaxID=1946007 RepID=UPI00257CF1BA|nr:hypothetical protein [Alistipes sp. UBA1686]
MKFTTPCFVRVEDAEKRTELLKWMFDVGYAGRYRIDPSCPIVVAGLEKDCADVACAGATEGLAVFGLIDCGDNIELFKALVAMNDENDMQQLFICDTYADIGCVMWHLCENKKFKHYYVEWEDGETDIRSEFRKATVEEIIKHFKKS